MRPSEAPVTGSWNADGAVRRRSLFHTWIAGIAALSLAAFAVLYVVVGASLDRAGEAAAKRAVDADLVAFADIYESGGKEELIRRIADRLTLGDAGSGAHYALTDARGRLLAGEAPAALPAQAARRTTPLDADLRLTVVRETGAWEAASADVLRTLLLVGAVLVLLAIAMGVVASFRLRRRIANITAALSDIDRRGGDTLPREHSPDEIDEVVAQADAVMQRLARSLDAHRDMSDHTAHEIRTPLTHLRLRLHSILETGGETFKPDIVGMLERALADIAGVVAVLDSLLDISASEAHRDQYASLPPVDLTRLVCDLAEMYEEHAADSGVAFDVHVAPGIVMPGDGMQLARMVTNLLDNAFKYCAAQGGRIALTLEPGPVLTVSDNGPGVDPQLRDRIFDRFTRAPSSGIKGHGLGLALARAIAERHGLRLRLIDDGAGAGAVFRAERKRVDE